MADMHEDWTKAAGQAIQQRQGRDEGRDGGPAVT